jgi:ribonuclease R
MEVEREMLSYECARWMSRRLGLEFEAVVSGVTKWGLYATLKEAFVEGLIPAELIADRVFFREDELALYTGGEGECFRLGDAVRVKAVAADVATRKISFGLAGDIGPRGTPKKTRQNRRQKKDRG